MKPCASPLALLLILALVMPALPARAVAAPRCKESRSLDSMLGTNTYLKACEAAMDKMAAAASEAQTADTMQAPKVTTQEGQFGSVQGVADMSGAGSSTLQQKAEITSRASGAYRAVAQDLNKIFDHFRKKDAPQINRLSRLDKTRVTDQADRAVNQELRGLYETSLEQAGALQQKASQLSTNASQLNQMRGQNQRIANQLDGGQGGGSGVGSGTWVALGGAALIAAGTVGGIAYFGNKGLDKMDKIADQKIEKAGNEAKEVIKEAEETAKRIIEFASSKASTVLANAEQTVKNIIENAKKEGEAIIDKIAEEIQAQFENLSDTGLAKLRDEMDSVFAEAIAKAKNSGDTKLEETLTKARDKTMAKIQKEINRRAAAGGPKSTTSNTNTATSTSTSTNTSTSSSTGSTSSTGTSTVTTTSTSSSTVTNTSSSTSTDSRQ